MTKFLISWTFLKDRNGAAQKTVLNQRQIQDFQMGGGGGEEIM